MDSDIFINLTAEIVSAHLGNNKVNPADVPGLIRTVFDALNATGAPPPPVEEARQPAVSIRSSVRPGAITCLECGAKFKMLKRHLITDHQLTPGAYRARWSLNDSYPLVAPDYSARRAELTKTIGLGRKGKPPAEGVRKPSGRKPKADSKAVT